MIDRLEFERAAQELLTPLYRIAISILRRDADARDAVQQALLKAWEKRERIEQDSFRAYISRITVNECRNVQRRRMREVPLEAPPVPETVTADYRDLYEALYELPDDYRLCVVLKYLQGYSEREAAGTLSIPITTFKTRLHRARKLLRKLLDREVTFE